MTLFVNPVVRATDANGDTLSGATLTFYRTGTLELASIYTTSDRTTAHPNPVTADAGGLFAPIYLDPSIEYRAVLKNSSGSTIQTIDPYVSIGGAGGRNVKTPFDFGAVGDGLTDDTDALQAFFDDAEDQANALTYIYDFSMGVWAVSGSIYISREYEAPQAEIIRRFRAGTIRALTGATFDTLSDNGRANSFVVAVRDYRNQFSGAFYVDGRPYSTATSPPTVSGMRGYSSRLFDVGVYLVDTNSTQFETLMVDGAKRDGVRTYNGSFSLRTGTEHEAAHQSSSANNIGMSFDTIHVRYSGSYGESTHSHSTAMSIASNSGSAGSIGQRTVLTVTSSSELELYDTVKCRLEVAAATFTSIAGDNTASTLTWTAGNPETAGFQVGDLINLVDGSAVGSNDVSTFLILGFSGGSSRTITVWPQPTTETAKAYTAMNSGWSYHTVMAINSATSIDVYPWVPSRTNSLLRSCHGFAARAIGGNAGAVNCRSLLSIVTGGGLMAAGLYNWAVGTFLPEFSEVGVKWGYEPSSGAIGLSIDQIHAEASGVPILQAGAGGTATIKGVSALALSGCVVLYPRSATTDGPMPHTAFANGMTIMMGNETLSAPTLPAHARAQSFSDAAPLSNRPSERGPRKLFLASPSVVLDYDYDIGRLFGGHYYAEVEWYSTTGTTPGGTATFTLSTKLTKAGWSMVGTTSYAAPPAPVKFLVSWDYDNKRVTIYTLLLRQALEGSATWNPASIANAAQASTTITVTGAALGDYVQVAPSIDIGALIISARVSAANTVTVTYANLSGGAIDAVDHTIRALVQKRG